MNKDFTDLTGYPGTTTVTGDVLIELDPNRTPVWYGRNLITSMSIVIQ
jgi:hypothetical protein